MKTNRIIKALGAGLLVLILCTVSMGAAAAVDTQKPARPTGLTAVSVDTASVRLTWQKSTDNVGVASYAVFKDQAYLTYTTKTEVTITGLAPGTSYVFYVAAQDAAGNISGASEKITVKTKSSGTSGKIIAGYYASWAAYSDYTPKDIPVSQLTHILYAFANIDSSYKVVMGDPEVDSKNFSELRSLKKENPSLKTLISIGGWEWSGRFSDAAATASRREAFAWSAAEFVAIHGFDGVDIDWEFPVSGGMKSNSVRAADKENYTLLLKELREKLDAQGKKDGKRYLLTIAGGAGQDFVGNVQMKAIAQYLDFGVVMAYDIHGYGDKYTDHNAPLYGSTAYSPQQVWSADQAVNAWSNAGFPKSKMVMGVPFYGHCYTNVQGGGSGIHKTYSGYKTLYYDTIVSQYLPNKAYTRYYGAAGRTPWLFNGSTFITYEDAASLKEKVAYIKNQGLAGAGIWELSQNEDGTLLNVMYKNMR